jgi:hypothetical protein
MTNGNHTDFANLVTARTPTEGTKPGPKPSLNIQNREPVPASSPAVRSQANNKSRRLPAGEVVIDDQIAAVVAAT